MKNTSSNNRPHTLKNGDVIRAGDKVTWKDRLGRTEIATVVFMSPFGNLGVVLDIYPAPLGSLDNGGNGLRKLN